MSIDLKKLLFFYPAAALMLLAACGSAGDNKSAANAAAEMTATVAKTTVSVPEVAPADSEVADTEATEETTPEIKDTSDPDAADITSDTMTGFRIEFDHTGDKKGGGFRSGSYMLLAGDVEGSEETPHNCGLFCDGERITSFDIDEEDISMIDEWLAGHSLKEENGWNKKSIGDEDYHLVIEAAYEGETLNIVSEGKAAAPEGWDEEGFLELVETIAGKHC